MTPGTEPALSVDEWLSGINRSENMLLFSEYKYLKTKTKAKINRIHVCIYISRSGAHVLKRGLQQTKQAGVQGSCEGEEGWSGQWDWPARKRASPYREWGVTRNSVKIFHGCWKDNLASTGSGWEVFIYVCKLVRLALQLLRMFFRQQEELRRLKDELTQKDIKIRQLELELNNIRNSPNINNNNNCSSNGSSIWHWICAVYWFPKVTHIKPWALLKHTGFLLPKTPISLL